MPSVRTAIGTIGSATYGSIYRAESLPSHPFTFATWFKWQYDVVAGNNYLFGFNHSTDANFDRSSTYANGTDVTFTTRKDATYSDCVGTPIAAGNDAWYHVVCVVKATNSRTVWLDGTVGTSNATQINNPAIDRLSWGTIKDVLRTDALFAYSGVWTNELPPAAIAQLAAGRKPLDLVAYRSDLTHAYSFQDGVNSSGDVGGTLSESDTETNADGPAMLGAGNTKLRINSGFSISI